MKKWILLAFAFAMAHSASATGVDFTVVPASPIVFDSMLTLPNGVQILPPWFRSRYNITTDQDATVTGMRITVQHPAGGVAVFQINLPQPIFVPASQSVSTNDFYLARLPYAPDYIYDVQVELQGWLGGPNKPVGRINTIKTYQTQ
jgi:hypothetical protein